MQKDRQLVGFFSFYLPRELNREILLSRAASGWSLLA